MQWHKAECLHAAQQSLSRKLAHAIASAALSVVVTLQPVRITLKADIVSRDCMQGLLREGSMERLTVGH